MWMEHNLRDCKQVIEKSLTSLGKDMVCLWSLTIKPVTSNQTAAIIIEYRIKRLKGNKYITEHYWPRWDK